MTDIAIKVENLGKLYHIGQFAGYKTIRETLMDIASAPFRRLRQTGDGRQKTRDASPPNTIWALKDVSFEVKRGEAVGIIGRNGSGKSTLLKILTRITAPTEGRVEIHGRVGSLLEVGTGFHPELTGRENIYLNGAVLGMKRDEIKRKFDEIVAFAEIEKFLDTPVKRYSSGMYVRLAFSVAAHLEPEILAVDEVLAVGDAAFQKKCLGKMGNVASEGRTVLFVSHNMGAIQNLCESCILVDDGKLVEIGKTRDVVSTYSDKTLLSSSPLIERKEQKNAEFIIRAIEFLNSKGDKSDVLLAGEDVSIALEFLCKKGEGLENVHIVYNITSGGDPVAMLHTGYSHPFERVPAKGRILCRIPRLPLLPGHYSLRVRSYSNHIMIHEIPDAAMFHVGEGPFFESGMMPQYGSEARFLVDHRWELEER